MIFAGASALRLERSCEVTVGTTSFDELVKEVDSEGFQRQVALSHFLFSTRRKSLATIASWCNMVGGATGREATRAPATGRLSQRDPAILTVER